MSASRLRQRIDLARLRRMPGQALKGKGGTADPSSQPTAERVRVDGRLTASEMPRLARLLASKDDMHAVSAVLELWSDASGLVVIDGTVEGELPLVCQRCLEHFDWPLRHSFRLALQDSETASRDSRDVEVLDGMGDSIVPADLIEEEILLAMPLAPRHSSRAECGPLVSKMRRPAGSPVIGAGHAGGERKFCPDHEAGSRGEEDNRKPFAVLASLLPANDESD